MTDLTVDATQRHENPHRVPGRRPLLPTHAFRPFSLALGVVLMLSGAVLLAHQLGMIDLGPVPTVAGAIVASACMLVGIALGWSHHASAIQPEADTRAVPLEDTVEASDSSAAVAETSEIR